jgi:pyrimidine deaminase RibD-like protein
MKGTARDRELLRQAIDLAGHAPPSRGAYSVGCVIADGNRIVASGYSREFGEHTHAEQVAIEKAMGDRIALGTATLYTSMEPCSVRGSGLRPCAARILDVGIRRVVFAMREPSLFVEGHGAEVLALAGVDVIQIDDLASAAAAANAHLVN